MPLRELTVENLAVVEAVRLSLAPGFTVLTGETGAGKSLVVDAVALALGARRAAGRDPRAARAAAPARAGPPAGVAHGIRRARAAGIPRGRAVPGVARIGCCGRGAAHRCPRAGAADGAAAPPGVGDRRRRA